MTNTESRLRAALKAELDTVEPSPLGWELIRRGHAQQAPQRRDVRRPLTLAVATAAAVVLVVGAVLVVTPSDTDQVADVLPAKPGDQAGLVVDELGDARAPHLDLASVSVQVMGDDVRITWRLAGPVPDGADPVDYRVAFIDSEEGGEPVVVVVRLDGETRVAAVGRCEPADARPADCSGRRLGVVSAEPDVDGETVTVVIPVSEIGVPVGRLNWTAYVREHR